MHRLIPLLALALTLRLFSVSSAELIVNPPRAITHRVSVQVIQTALSNGTSPAAVFGDPTREAAIEAAIDTIWSQAGIDVDFLPNVVRYNDTFAYQGSAPGSVRPITDLSVMLTNAHLKGGILNPDPAVINLFFVNVVPGFNLKSANWANGVGNIGHNGIAMFIGENVSAEHAGHWVSHELAHNLGLRHSPAGVQNLLATSRNTELLTDDQIGAIFQTQGREDTVAYIPHGGTGFPQLLPLIPGDYDRDGVVDAADYALWRKTMNTSGNLAADGNGNGRIDSGDYSVWRTNYGKTGGAALGATLPDTQLVDNAGVPEPGAMALLLTAMTGLLLAIRRPR